MVCFLRPVYYTGKRWERRGRTGGLDPQTDLVKSSGADSPIATQCCLGGRGRGVTKEATTVILKPSLKLFTDYPAADDTSGVLSLFSVERLAAGGIRSQHLRAQSGLRRIFCG